MKRGVLRAINGLRRQPEAAEVRRERWWTEAWGYVWAVPVRETDDGWFILWTPQDPDAVLVIYLGPQP